MTIFFPRGGILTVWGFILSGMPDKEVGITPLWVTKKVLNYRKRGKSRAPNENFDWLMCNCLQIEQSDWLTKVTGRLLTMRDRATAFWLLIGQSLEILSSHWLIKKFYLHLDRQQCSAAVIFPLLPALHNLSYNCENSNPLSQIDTK